MDTQRRIVIGYVVCQLWYGPEYLAERPQEGSWPLTRTLRNAYVFELLSSALANCNYCQDPEAPSVYVVRPLLATPDGWVTGQIIG